jgi:nucleoside-diphosphate-sugar epimerase
MGESGTHVAVVGAAGVFGQALVPALQARGHKVTAVTRATYAEARAAEYDVVVNTAMPSKRFWARQHPELDYAETVTKTADLLYGWHFTRFVQISTLSVRTERDSVYGRHKAAAEVLCERPDTLTVRLTALYSERMTKGAIVDIISGGPVFVDGNSRYAFTPVSFAADWVASNLGRTGVVEVGARDTVTLQDIATALGRQVPFSGPVEDQTVQNADPSWPSARDVIDFARQLARKHIP